MAVVGMDFGTHSCYIAVARAGGIETIANEYSDRSTPTYVGLNEKIRVMGAAAKQQATTNVKNTMSGFKSLIGRKFADPVAQLQISRLHYKVTEGPGGTVGIHVKYMGEDQVFSPEQITAMMMTKLKHIAEAALKMKVIDVVVSVPCSLTDLQRRTMLEVCQIAGLNCLRLMNDHLAVSLAYGIYKQDLPAENEKARHVVFVDMGYTSLQVSLCAFNKGKLKMLAVVTDPNLGGRDFDRVLLEYFAAEFKKKYKIDILANPKASIRMNTEVEKVKKLMSANTQKIPINIECLMNDIDIHTSIDRETFNNLSETLLARTKQTLSSLFQQFKFSMNDVHSVEIVGGSSRVAAVKSLVKEAFGMEPSTTLNADEAVARGCALQCAILSPTFRVRDFSISDCQLYPITLRWQGGLNEDSDLEICPKFHAVPFFKMLTYFRKEPLTLTCKYTYPNDIPFPDPTIGSFRINNIVPQPNGDSSKVKVKVCLNIHGIFSVSSASLVEKLPESEGDGAKDDAMSVDAPKINGDVGANNVEMGKSDTEQSSSNEDQTAAHESMSLGNEDEATAQTNQTTQNETPNDIDAGKNSNEKTDKKDEKKSPKKKTVKMVDLPIETLVVQLTKAELNNLIEQEAQMVMQDKLEKERQYAKNAVEEYVYEMRERIYALYEQYITEAERDNFSALLNSTENWLYEEGEDVNKGVYTKKLDSLKVHGDPIVKRYSEANTRMEAFEALGAALQRTRKVLELAAVKDEKYEHLTCDDLSKVEKCVKQKTDWFEKQFNLVNKQPLHEDPVVLTSQIVSEHQTLESICGPIINRPKPKVEPPKEAAAENTVDKKDVTMETNAPPPAEQQGQGEGSNETMDVE